MVLNIYTQWVHLHIALRWRSDALQRRSNHVGLHMTSSYTAVAVHSPVLVRCYGYIAAKSNHARCTAQYGQLLHCALGHPKISPKVWWHVDVPSENKKITLQKSIAARSTLKWSAVIFITYRNKQHTIGHVTCYFIWRRQKQYSRYTRFVNIIWTTEFYLHFELNAEWVQASRMTFTCWVKPSYKKSDLGAFLFNKLK